MSQRTSPRMSSFRRVVAYSSSSSKAFLFGNEACPLAACCFAVLVIFANSAVEGAETSRGIGPRALLCYVASWTQLFNPTQVQPELCSMLMYAFATINDNGTLIEESLPGDPEKMSLGGLVVAVNASSTPTPVGVAIGGWGEGSERFSPMASEAATRKLFIDSVLRTVERWSLESVELAWISPTIGWRGGRKTDRANYNLLVEELSRELQALPRNVTLGVAIPVADFKVEEAFDLATLARHADWLRVQGHDLHGHWDFFTDVNAPLESPRPGDNNTVTGWLRVVLNRVPASRVVLGIPAFGRTWTLADSPVPGGLGARSVPGALFSNQGMMAYNEICPDLTTDDEERRWTQHWDAVSKTPFATKGSSKQRGFVSYDDAPSVREKVKLAVNLGLAGVGLFTIDNDDHSAACGPAYPLLKAAQQALKLQD